MWFNSVISIKVYQPVEVEVKCITADEKIVEVSKTAKYEVGDEATVIAKVVNSAYVFVGWKDADGNIVSKEKEYTFVVEKATTLTASYKEKEKFTIEVSSKDPSTGTVSGGGTYYEGQELALSVTPAEGYKFDHWEDGEGNRVSLISPVTGNAKYVAVFVKDDSASSDDPVGGGPGSNEGTGEEGTGGGAGGESGSEGGSDDNDPDKDNSDDDKGSSEGGSNGDSGSGSGDSNFSYFMV